MRLRWNSFEQLGHLLGLGHEVRRANQRRDRLRVVGGIAEDQVLDGDEADDVVQRLVVDREARVLLLADERAQLANRRLGLDRDDVRPRRHHLAHHRLAEFDERPQQLARLSLLQSRVISGAVGTLAAGVSGSVALADGCRSRRGMPIRRSAPT